MISRASLNIAIGYGGWAIRVQILLHHHVLCSLKIWIHCLIFISRVVHCVSVDSVLMPHLCNVVKEVLCSTNRVRPCKPQQQRMCTEQRLCTPIYQERLFVNSHQRSRLHSSLHAKPNLYEWPSVPDTRPAQHDFQDTRHHPTCGPVPRGLQSLLLLSLLRTTSRYARVLWVCRRGKKTSHDCPSF